ncbi:MAG: Zinc-type alcohol dehydrogenase YcjQ, partial [uncultured Blastococcus sp.]
EFHRSAQREPGGGGGRSAPAGDGAGADPLLRHLGRHGDDRLPRLERLPDQALGRRFAAVHRRRGQLRLPGHRLGLQRGRLRRRDRPGPRGDAGPPAGGRRLRHLGTPQRGGPARGVAVRPSAADRCRPGGRGVRPRGGHRAERRPGGRPAPRRDGGRLRPGRDRAPGHPAGGAVGRPRGRRRHHRSAAGAGRPAGRLADPGRGRRGDHGRRADQAHRGRGRRRHHRAQWLLPGAARGGPLHGAGRPGRRRRLLPGGRRRAAPRRGVPPQPHPDHRLPDRWRADRAGGPVDDRAAAPGVHGPGRRRLDRRRPPDLPPRALRRRRRGLPAAGRAPGRDPADGARLPAGPVPGRGGRLV